MTPHDADAQILQDVSGRHIFSKPGTECSEDHSLSVNHPAISSMEVECSGITDRVDAVERSDAISIAESVPPAPLDLKTPQRASEVFGFLAERRKSLRDRTMTLPLPRSSDPVPTRQTAAESMPSLLLTTPIIPSSISPDDSHDRSQESSNISHAQVHTATVIKLSSAPATINDLHTNYKVGSSAPQAHAREDIWQKSVSRQDFEKPVGKHQKRQAMSTGIISRVSTIDDTNMPVLKPRIPRGPRAPQRDHSSKLSTSSQTDLPMDLRAYVDVSDIQATGNLPLNSKPPASGPSDVRVRPSNKHKANDMSNDALTAIGPRKQRRIASRSSTLSTEDLDGSIGKRPGRSTRKFSAKRYADDKENSAEGSVPLSPDRLKTKSSYGDVHAQPKTAPTTPLRSRAIFDARYPQGLGASDGAVAPSPASSSELSPLARDMMTNLRKQRMRAREAETRKKFGRSMRAIS